MQLLTHRRSRAAVGAAAAAAMAGTAFLAMPAAAAADPADGLGCRVAPDWAKSQLGVDCYDDVAGQAAAVVDYQWERDGVAIPGATSSTYQYQSTDMGHLFSATVGVDRAGTKVTVPIGRASAPEHQALYLMDGCGVTVSNRLHNQGGASLLDGADLNDTLTLEVSPPVASNLTVAGPYWTMTTASHGEYVLPRFLADQAQGWTVTLSDLASIDAILGRVVVHAGRPPTATGLEERGVVEVHNSFTVSGGDVSATVSSCPWGPDAPSGRLDTALFGGGKPQYYQTPNFPIADHAAGDTGVQGTLTATTVGWYNIGVYEGWDFTYQWTRGDQLIPGATSKSYTLTAEDSGKKIGLVLRGNRPDAPAEYDLWIWGEVTAGEIKAPATDPDPSASPTASAAASPSATAGAGQAGTVPLAGAGSDAKAQSGSPSTLAKTGSAVLPVVGLAGLLLAGGAAVLIMRRRAQLG